MLKPIVMTTFAYAARGMPLIVNIKTHRLVNLPIQYSKLAKSTR